MKKTMIRAGCCVFFLKATDGATQICAWRRLGRLCVPGFVRIGEAMNPATKAIDIVRNQSIILRDRNRTYKTGTSLGSPLPVEERKPIWEI